jgi:hypothetical protein
MESYGFIYLWYDRKHKRYYVGCHWGREDDGYVCSSYWMMQAYKRRPEDFKRRMLKTNILDRTCLLDEEYKFLSLIKKEELGKKYYNIQNNHFGHWSNDPNNRDNAIEKMRQKLIGKSLSEEHKKKISKSNKGKKKAPFTEDHRKNISISAIGRVPTEETLKKRSIAMKGENNPNWGKKFTEEHRHKLSIARRKRVISEETKQKTRESMKKVVPRRGHKLTEEHKAKISLGMKKNKESLSN